MAKIRITVDVEYELPEGVDPDEESQELVDDINEIILTADDASLRRWEVRDDEGRLLCAAEIE